MSRGRCFLPSVSGGGPHVHQHFGDVAPAQDLFPQSLPLLSLVLLHFIGRGLELKRFAPDGKSRPVLDLGLEQDPLPAGQIGLDPTVQSRSLPSTRATLSLLTLTQEAPFVSRRCFRAPAARSSPSTPTMAVACPSAQRGFSSKNVSPLRSPSSTSPPWWLTPSLDRCASGGTDLPGRGCSCTRPMPRPQCARCASSAEAPGRPCSSP